MEKDKYYTEKRRRRVKLIFNPAAGSSVSSSIQLMDVINLLQAWKFVPEVFITKKDSNYGKMVKDTLLQGVNFFVVCGGDGTVSAVAKEIIGLPATLGIIPKGTQNNVARSLNIPENLEQAVAILREGRRIKADMGQADCGKVAVPFLEVCSVGLMSSLFSAGDDIQHGHLERLGDFLGTFVNSTPSQIRLKLEDKNEIVRMGHVVIVSNMPYIGRHCNVGKKNAYSDGLLDVMLFSSLNKMDLLGCAFKGRKISETNDPCIQHFFVHKAEIETKPEMQIMADGVILGKGSVKIEVKHHSVAVMTIPSKTKNKSLREAADE